MINVADCRLSSIRSGLGRALNANRVPRLEFCRNEMDAQQAAVEEIFFRLERERQH